MLSAACLSDPLDPQRSTPRPPSTTAKRTLVREAMAAAQALNVLKRRLDADSSARECSPAAQTRHMIYSYKFAKFI